MRLHLGHDLGGAEDEPYLLTESRGNDLLKVATQRYNLTDHGGIGVQQRFAAGVDDGNVVDVSPVTGI